MVRYVWIWLDVVEYVWIYGSIWLDMFIAKHIHHILHFIPNHTYRTSCNINELRQ